MIRRLFVLPTTALAAVVALSASILLTSSAARAQDDNKGSMTLLEQTDWVNEASPVFNLDVEFTSSLPSDQLELNVSVYSAVGNRSSFQRSLEDQMTGSPLITERRPISEISTSQSTARLALPV